MLRRGVARPWRRALTIDRVDGLADLLTQSAVFRNLSRAARRALVVGGSTQRVMPGRQLVIRGEPGDAAFLVLSGTLEVAIPSPDGHEVWLAELGEGAMIGEMAVLDGGPRSADVVAASEAVVLRLGKQAVLDALLAEPRVALDLLALMSARLRATNALVEGSAALDIGGRLARQLLGDPGSRRRSQADLARHISASRESVNRKLAAWQAEGLIAIRDRVIEVLDQDALERLAGLRRR